MANVGTGSTDLLLLDFAIKKKMISNKIEMYTIRRVTNEYCLSRKNVTINKINNPTISSFVDWCTRAC
jgi:hypothetical protein